MITLKRLVLSILALSTFLSSAFVLAGKWVDIKGAKDHPMISRFENSVIAKYNHNDYDELEVPITSFKAQPIKKMTLEGKYTAIGYLNPQKASIAAVYKSYSKALKKSGFEEIFKCKGRDECGNSFAIKFLNQSKAGSISAVDAERHSTSRYLLTKLARPEGDVYVVLFVYSNTYDSTRTWLFVVESESLEEDLIKVDTDADGMDKALADLGRIALYGIFFDSGKSDVKPESNSTIGEIVKLLNNNEMLNLIIVGHTDNQGEMEYNMNLSKNRAKSVVDTLVNNHRISAKRLKHWGVGFMSPVASNRTEEGRAKNRRVELVEQ